MERPQIEIVESGIIGEPLDDFVDSCGGDIFSAVKSFLLEKYSKMVSDTIYEVIDDLFLDFDVTLNDRGERRVVVALLGPLTVGGSAVRRTYDIKEMFETLMDLKDDDDVTEICVLLKKEIDAILTGGENRETSGGSDRS